MREPARQPTTPARIAWHNPLPEWILASAAHLSMPKHDETKGWVPGTTRKAYDRYKKRNNGANQNGD